MIFGAKMFHITKAMPLIIGLLIILCLCGCQNLKAADEPAPLTEKTAPGRPDNTGAPDKSDEPDFAEVRPRAIDRKELTVVFSAGEIELDFRKSFLASEAQLFTAIYEGLFSYHPFTMEPVPAIAEDWDVSEDKRQWTFTLRNNAKYWNGDSVDAEHFRSAWLSLLSPQRESPYSSLFDVIEGAREYRMGIEKNPAKVGIIAKGSKTLIVKLNSPASFFPAMLCHHSFSPIHPSMVSRENWSAPQAKGSRAWQPPVSNGPFRITSMTDDLIVMEKAGTYWDSRRVSLNTINIVLSDDPDKASSLWNSGEARWLSGDFNWDALKDRSGIQVNAMFATHYYFIRSEHRPWNDHRIRRALILALPWEELRSKHILPATTLIYPLSGYPEIEGLTDTDLDEARQLLVDAGYAGGMGMPEIVLRLTPSQEATRIGALMAAAWNGKLGVPVRVEVYPYSEYFSSLKQSGYTVGLSTWIGDFADPYTFLQMWRRDSNLNDAQYNDDDFEDLMEKSMREEGETRLATLAEAEKLLLNRGSVIPISYTPAINIVDTDEIGGWFPNALDIHPFKYLNFRAFRPLPGVVKANSQLNDIRY